MKPIPFNTDMARALLEGRKTVTRRVVKPQPEKKPIPIPDEKYWIGCFSGCDVCRSINPPYHSGSILYVRETFKIDYLSNVPGSGRIRYKADNTYSDFTFVPERYDMMRRAQLKPGWRPNENMPREAARLFLRVTDVRAERLQDIDDIRALEEGAEGDPCDCDGSEVFCSRCCNTGWITSPRSEFAGIWDSTIKPADRALYGWEANPYVWVIEFERCEKPKEETT